MEKNKSLYVTLVVVFCVILSGLSVFFLGTNFVNNHKTPIKNNENKNNNEENKPTKINVEDYKQYTFEILYNFIQSKNGDLNNYLTNLNNNQKLYAAGLLYFENEDEKFKNQKFEDLKENLVNIYGTDLNVLPNDYYILPTDEEPLFKYNKETDEYIYNENTPGTDIITDLSNGYIYNYKLESTEEKDNILTITYYGLYALQDEIGPTTVTNANNISRLINYDSEFDKMSDEEYFKQAFANNKDDFFKFTYSYKKVDNKYILIDFKQA